MSQFFEIPNLEKFNSQNPRSVIFSFLASRHLEQGNLDRAIAVCEKGVAQHPGYPFGHFVLGLCYYQNKDYARAKKHLEISTALDDKNPKAWKLLGEVNEELDLAIQAEECYQQYYLLDSFNPDALEKYQKEEMIDFDLFAREGEPDLIAGERMHLDVDKMASDEEKEYDSFFEEALSEEQEGASFEEDEVPGGREEKEGADEHLNIDDEELVEASSDEMDLSEGVSDDRTEAFEVEEDREKESGREERESEELLDFRSVVKDIISETGGESDLEEERDTDAAGKRVPDERGSERPPIVTPTVGEICIAQGRFAEAVSVFEQLLEKDPGNQKYQRKIRYLKRVIEEGKK